MDFTDLLRLIDERSAAFGAVVASAPSLDAPVPSCPGWTLFDLVRHLGEGRRAWAATITAGPDARARSASDGPAAPREREALLAWMAASTRELVETLREAGPDRGCWTWWGRSQSPQTCGAVARHLLQETAVHTYDAQLALGDPQPLPDEVALDGVEEFLSTCSAWTGVWSHEPGTLDYHATEGRSWRLRLSAGGGRVTRLTEPGPADASVWGTASELVLLFYGRVPLDSLKLDGDRRIFEQLIEWDPDQ
jgi:uncharacterized protein (TIGR03083 family)